jgi:membrane protein DedA with SNARE-associated domain
VAEEALETRLPGEDGLLPEPPERRQRIVLDTPSWVPSEKLPRWLLFTLLVVVMIAALAGATVPFLLDWVNQDDFETLGYPGIFLANFLSNATGFIPVPGLTAIAQALIIASSSSLFAPGVVVAGASGMTLGETTAYLAGSIGRGIAEERQMPLKGRAGKALHRAAGWVDWAMEHYGFATLLALSAIPNPLFEFAGITAGAVRMNFWRFLIAVAIGKTIRVILLVIIGDALIDAFEL